MLLKKCPDLLHRHIHPALHITGRRIGGIIGNAFIVDEAVGIQVPEEPGHFKDHAPAEGFISHGPDQDRRMVLVPLIAAYNTVPQGRKPYLIIPGDRIYGPAAGHFDLPARGRCLSAAQKGIRPGPVGLHIVLCDEVDPVFVTETVQERRIGIMARPDRIDIVPLKKSQVLPDQLLTESGPSRIAGKLMPVHTFENDPFAVEEHQAVLQFEAAESHFFMDPFHCRAALGMQGNIKVIQGGIFRTPQRRCADRFQDHIILLVVDLAGEDRPSVLLQTVPGKAVEMPFHALFFRKMKTDLQLCALQGFVYERADLQVPHMHLRYRIQINVPENTREPEEILVLQPA